MGGFRVGPAAARRLDEIWLYSAKTWGEDQADRYIRGVFDCFAAIALREVRWRALPAEFGVNGYMRRHERHYIYWKVLDDASVGIVTVLHERMHQIARFRDDWRLDQDDP